MQMMCPALNPQTDGPGREVLIGHLDEDAGKLCLAATETGVLQAGDTEDDATGDVPVQEEALRGLRGDLGPR